MAARRIEYLDTTMSTPPIARRLHVAPCDPDKILIGTLTLGLHGETVVTVVGEVDLCAEPDLRAALLGVLDQPRLRRVVVDLRGVRFLSARGIATLVEFHSRAAARQVVLRVVADSRPVLWPLQLTGMDRVLDIQPDHGETEP